MQQMMQMQQMGMYPGHMARGGRCVCVSVCVYLCVSVCVVCMSLVCVCLCLSVSVCVCFCLRCSFECSWFRLDPPPSDIYIPLYISLHIYLDICMCVCVYIRMIHTDRTSRGNMMHLRMGGRMMHPMFHMEIFIYTRKLLFTCHFTYGNYHYVHQVTHLV